MVEAGGISKGRRATAGENMDGAMMDCVGRSTGGVAAAEAVAAAEIWQHNHRVIVIMASSHV